MTERNRAAGAKQSTELLFVAYSAGVLSFLSARDFFGSLLPEALFSLDFEWCSLLPLLLTAMTAGASQAVFIVPLCCAFFGLWTTASAFRLLGTELTQLSARFLLWHAALLPVFFFCADLSLRSAVRACRSSVRERDAFSLWLPLLLLLLFAGAAWYLTHTQ